MYINFEQLYRSDISESEFLLLIKISQKNTELISESDKETIDKLLSLELVELIKAGATIRERLRVSKKGKQFIKNIETANYSDDIQKLEQELVELYEANNKEVGLRADVKSRLTWFMAETGFRPSVVKKFVDEYLMETDPKYIKKLDNLIWTQQSKAFSIHFNLKDSKLFDIISARLGLQQTVFLDKRDKELTYLFKIGSYLPPKGLRPELYFTGSYETDYLHAEMLGKELTKRVLK